MAKRPKSWRDCAHCSKPVSGPHGDAPGKYHYPVPGIPIELLRQTKMITGVLLHHACKEEFLHDKSDSD